MNEPSIRHSHIRLNNSLTHLIQYGSKESFIKLTRRQSTPESSEETRERQYNHSPVLSKAKRTTEKTSTSEKDRSKCVNFKEFIVFVPGNPGILGVYHDFLVRLYKTLIESSARNTDTVIIGIGHNDFDHLDCCDFQSSDKICIEDCDLNFVEGSIAKERSPYDVELQVLNKVIILKKLVKVDPRSCRVVFIGHSIGCYIILRMLQDNVISAAHAGSILIHPALENVALTRKGSTISKYFDYKIDLAIRFVAYICERILPQSIRLKLAKWMCSPEFVRSSSEIVINSIAQLGCSLTVKALVEMAKSEFERVRDIDHKTLIEPHVDKLRLIYTDGDGWVNVESKEELRNSYPNLKIEEQSTLHAFTMSPEIMESYALKVSILVQDLLDCLPNKIS